MQKLGSPRDSFQAIVGALFFGVMVGEIFAVFAPISTRLSETLSNYCRPTVAFIGLQLIFTSLPFAFTFFSKNRRGYLFKVLSSFRFDLLLAAASGLFLVYVFDGFYLTSYRDWVAELSWSQVAICLFIYLFVFLGAPIIRLVRNALAKRESPASFFLGDAAIEAKENDGLNFSEDAKRLAERIYNNGSTESLIFGIDAPWGTGKSSFVNLCKEYWQENYQNKLIVYNFDPTRYTSRENLLDKFIDGLIREIKQHTFAPEIEPLFSKYGRLLKSSNISFSLLGFSFSLPFSSESLDDVFIRLEDAILNLDKKIIIIIDDLDRLHFSEIKEILYKIKNAFNLKNVSYVLCYDTKNLATFSRGEFQNQEIHQPVIEFLEKYVNIKYNLYLDSKILLNYFTENKEKSLAAYPFANPELVSKAVDGLNDIFSSKEFHRYVPFVGDIRKLKRLINSILLLEVEKTDFHNCDFNKGDLIHLLLIYINYPDVFRKIYYTETDKYGFFSVVTKYDIDDYPKEEKEERESMTAPLQYKNSITYENYLKTLTEEQQFLVGKVFDASVILKENRSDVPRDVLASRACFNGAGWGNAKNLKEYIELITKMSRPIKTGQHRFYLNKRDEFFQGKKLEDIFAENEFSNKSPDFIHEQFWRVLLNAPRENYSADKSRQVIQYALDHLPNYSFFEDLGLRHSLIFFIIKLLDKFGWIDEEEEHSDNSEENISSIARWIFGEGEFKGEGVIEVLAQKNRGILGFFDLLGFRLSCCKDRGGDVFNLSRALSIHGDPNAPIQGSVREILKEEMRELSQAIFALFKARYIDAKKNIFEEIDKVTLKNACGNWFEFYKSQSKTDVLQTKLLKLKSIMKGFMLYQLSNSVIDSGIGCGFYDPTGNKDEKCISKSMNDYLFNFCFDGTTNKKNYSHFVEFLLSHSTSRISSREPKFKYRPNVNESLRILDQDMLTAFWKKNSVEIKKLKLETKKTKLVTSNYEVTYKEGLPGIFEQLDSLLAPPTPVVLEE